MSEATQENRLQNRSNASVFVNPSLYGESERMGAAESASLAAETQSEEDINAAVMEIAHSHPETILTRQEGFDILMMRYDSAIREVRTKLEILNDELSLTRDYSPISSIISRRKKPMSIYQKLLKQENEISLASIEENLNDVAGVRVICPFIDDIYKVAKMLVQQDDITLIRVKDYIRNPKSNGYRSYHMIVQVPVFFSSEKKPMRVEVQIRTVAMDFWASLEHKMKYKKGLSEEVIQAITDDLAECAATISGTDMRMMGIRDRINELEKYNEITKKQQAYNERPDNVQTLQAFN